MDIHIYDANNNDEVNRMKNNDIKELNTFLKGLYMGVHAYEHYIANCDDSAVKKVLQKIQQEHKFSTMRVAERIQNLGGSPATDEGPIGSMVDWVGNFTTPSKTIDILKEALKNEKKYAVHEGGNSIKGDIIENNKKLIDDILERNEQHVQTLQKLLQEH